MIDSYNSLMRRIFCRDSQVLWVPCISAGFCLVFDVCMLDWRSSPVIFCVVPWGISVMTEDVKGSFDSMNTKEWFFRLKKKSRAYVLKLKRSIKVFTL